MRPDVVTSESLFEFFKCLVDRAMSHQGLRALDLTQFYLVQLLAGRARSVGPSSDAGRGDEPLALWFARALEAGGAAQRAELRGLADHALFVSGFFSDRLARGLVDLDYYASLGGHAYQQLGTQEGDTLAPAFAELGERFLTFSDVLAEVSEESGLTSDRDLLRLYERWVSHGSRRNQERLARHGIVPSGQAREAARRLH
jgi:hypothetical protein